MSSAIERPWVPTELPEPTKLPDLTDLITQIITSMFDDKKLADCLMSTDNEDCREGSLVWDKRKVAVLVHQQLESLGYENWTVKDVAARTHHAQKRLGISRKEIAAKKAAYLQLMSGETDNSGEGSTNS